MPIDPLPSISRSDTDFRTKVDDYFLTKLPTFSTQAEAARLQIVAAESTTTAAASTATSAATTATTAADTATTASSAAVTAKNAAETAAANAISTPVAAPIHAAPSKTTPADADELGITDSAASWGLKKLTFANLKAWIGGLFVSKSGDTINGNLNVTGNVKIVGSGALGYGVGSGGSVIQATSKVTGVALNKPNGFIQMSSGVINPGEVATFPVTCSYSTVSSVFSVMFVSGIGANGRYNVWCEFGGSGVFVVCVKNIFSSALDEPIGIHYVVTSGETS